MARDQFRSFTHHGLSRALEFCAQRDHHLRTEPKANVVGQRRFMLIQYGARGPLELDQHLGRRHGKALSDAHMEGHVGPPITVKVNAERGEGFDLRVKSYALFLAIAAELAAHDIGRLERADRFESARPRLSYGLTVVHGRLRHGQAGYHHQHVVLHHIANRSRFLVETAAARYSETFGHGDLHTLDVTGVPDPFKERIGEAKVEKILDRFLSQVVVDAEDRMFRERRVKCTVKRLRRTQVSTKRLFNDHTGVFHTSRLRQPFNNGCEHTGRNSEIVQRGCGGAELLAQTLEGRRFAIVAADVSKQPGEFGKGLSVEADLMRQTVADTSSKLLEIPVTPRYSDHRSIQTTAPDHGLQGRKNLLV